MNNEIIKDKTGRTIEIVSKKETEEICKRAKNCLEEIQQVLDKYKCRIESRLYDEERVIVPLNDKGNSYSLKENFEYGKNDGYDCVTIVSLDADNVFLADYIILVGSGKL